MSWNNNSSFVVVALSLIRRRNNCVSATSISNQAKSDDDSAGGRMLFRLKEKVICVILIIRVVLCLKECWKNVNNHFASKLEINYVIQNRGFAQRNKWFFDESNFILGRVINSIVVNHKYVEIVKLLSIWMLFFAVYFTQIRITPLLWWKRFIFLNIIISYVF